MTDPARLAVHVGRDVPAGLAAVLAATEPWAEAVAASTREPVPPGTCAHVYTSDVLPRRPDAPYAVWRVDGAAADGLDGVPVLCDVAAGPAPGDLDVCLLPWPDDARPVLPFTRSRYRMLRELPDQLVCEAGPDSLRWWTPGERPVGVPSDAWPTLAALSSVVVATGDRVWEALAWAAPVVTDPATARRLDVVDGEHVLVAEEPARRHDLAAGLAADDARAAGLARRGWQAAGARRPAAVAAQLCGRLGLSERRPPASRLAGALDSLGTPLDALVRRRARAATAVLPGAVTFGWRPGREEQP
jgi:hypothetical protein